MLKDLSWLRRFTINFWKHIWKCFNCIKIVHTNLPENPLISFWNVCVPTETIWYVYLFLSQMSMQLDKVSKQMNIWFSFTLGIPQTCPLYFYLQSHMCFVCCKVTDAPKTAQQSKNQLRLEFSSLLFLHWISFQPHEVDCVPCNVEQQEAFRLRGKQCEKVASVLFLIQIESNEDI